VLFDELPVTLRGGKRRQTAADDSKQFPNLSIREKSDLNVHLVRVGRREVHLGV